MNLKVLSLVVLLLAIFMTMNVAIASDVSDNNITLSQDINNLELGSEPTNELVDVVESDTLEINDEEIMSSEDNMNHIYVSPNGNDNNDGSISNPKALSFTSLNNIQANTVIHLLDGNYTLSASSSTDYFKIQNNNISFVGNNPDNVIISGDCSKASNLFSVQKDTNNFSLKNITIKVSCKSLLHVSKKSYGITVENCNFINIMSSSAQTSAIVKTDDPTTTCNITFNNCYFGNCSGAYIFRLIGTNFTISNCIFENNTIGCSNSVTVTNVIYFYNSCGLIDVINCTFRDTKGIYKNTGDESPVYIAKPTNNAYVITMNFTNNTIDSKYGIQYQVSTEGNTFVSDCTFIVLTDPSVNLTAGNKFTFTGRLVDDNGNIINTPDLNLLIENDKVKSTFVDGIYYCEYTVPNIGDSITIYGYDSANIGYNEFDDAITLNVKPAVSMNVDVQNVSWMENVTVNVTFTNLQSGSVVYTIRNSAGVVKNFTREFSDGKSSIVIENLDVGDYTVDVSTVETEDYGATTVSTSFKVNKITPTIELIADSVVPPQQNFIVKGILPVNATGNLKIDIYQGNTRYRTDSPNISEGVAIADINSFTLTGEFIIYATYNGDAHYAANTCNLTFEVAQVKPTLEVSYGDVTIFENVTITVKMNSGINDNVTITVNNNKVNRTLVNGSLEYVIENVQIGEYNINVSFAGNTQYLENSNSTSFTVTKIHSDITVTADNIYVGQNATITVNGIPDDYEGKITVDGKEYSINNGVIVVDGLNEGSKNLTVFLSETDKYANATAYAVFNVLAKESPSLIVDHGNVAIGEDVLITISMNSDINGNVTLTVDENTPINVVIVNGKGNHTISKVVAKTYSVLVNFAGSIKYNSTSNSTDFTVDKITPVITASAENILVGQDATITINGIPADYNGNITVDGKEAFVSGGTYVIENLTAGSKNITVFLPETGKYANATAYAVFTVSKNSLNINATAKDITVGNDAKITVNNIPEDYKGIITVNVDGANYSSTVISGLSAGSKTAVITLSSDDKYSSATVNATFKVSKIAADITIPTSVSMTYNTAKSVTLTTNGIADGAEVSVKVGSKTVKGIVKNNKVTVSLPTTLKPATYTANIVYAGDATHNSVSKSMKVVVAKAAPKLTAKKANFKAKTKTKKYKIVLKTNKNKALSKVKVTIKVGKKTFKATTNKKGKATFKITKLTKKGSYKAVVKTKANACYKAISKKVTIKVKK